MGFYLGGGGGHRIQNHPQHKGDEGGVISLLRTFLNRLVIVGLVRKDQAFNRDVGEQGIPAEQNQTYTLYPNLQAAKRGIEVNVLLPDISGLEAGKTTVYYQNVSVGVLSELDTAEVGQDKVVGKLLLDPSIDHLLKTNSYIVIRSQKLNLGNLADLPAILRGDYLELIPGDGEESHQFTVYKENELLLQQPNTLVFTLTAPETYDVAEGQKIYYNNILHYLKECHNV